MHMWIYLDHGSPTFSKKHVWQNNLPSFSGDSPPRFQNAHPKYASKSWTAACLLSVQTLLGWLGAFGTGDRCDAWYRRLIWSAVKIQPCQCNWGILWEIAKIMYCHCWLLSAISERLSVYLEIRWEIMDQLLDIFRYHHGGKGLEAAVFYHNFYSHQGCPG